MATHNKLITVTIFVLVISINLFFGLPRLAQYTAVDETLWSYDRVPKFWRSVAKGNWRGTNLCDKPGITLAFISGAGLPFIPNPSEYEKLTRQAKTPEQLATIESIYFHLRLPVYIFSLLSLPIFYFLIKRLLGIAIARLSIIFIGLSPILLGISLIVNTDAMLWIMAPITLLSFLIYQKESNKKFLYLTGFLLGMAILTKFVANFLFPFFLMMIFVKYIMTEHNSSTEKIEWLKKNMLDFLTITAIALATIFIFYPSAWIKPKELLNTTIYSLALKKLWPFLLGAILLILADVYLIKSFFVRKICDFISNHKKNIPRIAGTTTMLLVLFVFINVSLNMKFYDFEGIMAAPKPDISFLTEFFANFFSSFFPLIYGLTPIVAISFISALFFLIQKRNTNNDAAIHTFYLVLFMLAYYFANSFASISSTVRYQIIMYPIASIIAAIGFQQFISSEWLKRYLPRYSSFYFSFFIILFSIISLASIKPFFLAYSSELLPDKYIMNPKDMGDGSWETSQYLNSLPDANKLSIWSDKKQVCEKFIGKCDTGFNAKTVENKRFDYLIVSTGGQAETTSRSWQKGKNLYSIGNNIIDPRELYSPTGKNEFKVTIDEKSRNFIKVIKTNNQSQESL